MTITEAEYFTIRSELLREEQAHILAIEQKYMNFLLEITLAAANTIFDDFSRAMELMPFWVNYSPIQRGRGPTGTSIPWGEVGEKTISEHLVRSISLRDPSITFPGLPFGSDIRFATSDALIHFDMKLTGPNDNQNEIVASPNQISGDGISWSNGVVNSPVKVSGDRAVMQFQPELPPFYVLDKQILLCLTYFLKAVYQVKDLGIQPLHYFELACVPNGLLLFDGPKYAQSKGLLIPGKDEKNQKHKRTRVRFKPLAALASWRCMKLVQENEGWKKSPRSNSDQLHLF